MEFQLDKVYLQEFEAFLDMGAHYSMPEHIEMRIQNFWTRWKLLHTQTLKAIVRTQDEVQLASDSLLKERARIVSSFTQCLKNIGAPASVRIELRNQLKGHDEIFSQVVDKYLEDLKPEIAKANNAKKAIGAYAQSSQFRGV